MILTPEQRKRLLDGLEVEVRVLKKEGESGIKRPGATFILTKNNKIKFQVGKDYAVQEAGKASMVYARNGKCYCEHSIDNNLKNLTLGQLRVAGWKSFRFQITGIRIEHLLDVTEEGAKKGGGKNMGCLGGIREHYLGGFARMNYPKLYKKFHHKNIIDINAGKEGWKEIGNPEVWVLSGKIKE